MDPIHSEQPGVQEVLDSLMSHFHTPATTKVVKSVKLPDTMCRLVENQASLSGVTFSDWVRRAIIEQLRRTSNGEK